jgi:hypothetical protein
MKAHVVPSQEAVRVRSELEYALRIAGVYQDSLTCDWVLQICRQAADLAGEKHVQSAWHSTHSLGDPGILADAIRAAVAADLIVVSVHAAAQLPMGLCVWVEGWLPRRNLRDGALVALVGAAEPPSPQALRALDYLQGVARKGRLDFIPQERRLPVASPAFMKPGAAEPVAVAQALQGQSYDPYIHCGLND